MQRLNEMFEKWLVTRGVKLVNKKQEKGRNDNPTWADIAKRSINKVAYMED